MSSTQFQGGVSPLSNGGASGLGASIGDFLGTNNSAQVNEATNQYTNNVQGVISALGQYQNGGVQAQALNPQMAASLGALGQYANGGAASAAQQYAQNQEQQAQRNIASSALSNQAGVNPGLTQRNIALGTANANGQIGAGAVTAGVQAQGSALNGYNNALNSAYTNALNTNAQNIGLNNDAANLYGSQYNAQMSALGNQSNAAATGLQTFGNFANAAGSAMTAYGQKNNND